MVGHLYALQARLQRIGRQVALASAAGALVLTGAALLSAAGIVWLSARYGVLIGLCTAGAALIVAGLLVFVIGKPRPAKAVAQSAPLAGEAVLPGASVLGASGSVLHAAKAALPPGSGAAIAGAVSGQLARRPVKAVAAAVALGAVIGVVQSARGLSGRRDESE